MINFLAAVDLGKISPPPGTVSTGGDPSGFIAGAVRGGLSLLLIVAFVIGLIWMIFAGYSFIFAGDDPKKVSSAWSRIYWILIGLVVVGGSFAIIKLVEVFFDVKILSTTFKIPTIK